MNIRAPLLLVVLSALLAGCNQMPVQQTTYYPSTPRSQPDPKIEKMRAGNQAASECSKTLADTPHGKIVFSQITPLNDSQANNLDLLSSKSRLNEPQKKALRQYLAANTNCRNLRLDANQGLPSESIYRKDSLEKDILYGKLLNGQITIGEFNASWKKQNLATVDALKNLNQRQAQNLQSPPSSGKVIGQSFDNQANGNIFLYDGPCKIDNYRSSYPLRWDAKNASSGAHMGEGCYSLNQQTQQVFLIGPNGKPMSLPLANFQGGGNKSFFQSFSEGLQRATTYWNNSAAETQRNTTNLTPGLTGGNSMNCTPDGRGGFNCR